MRVLSPRGTLCILLCNSHRPLVNPGQHVLWGELIAEPGAWLAVQVRASASGTVSAVERTHIAIIADDDQPAAPVLFPPLSPHAQTREAVIERARAAGMVGQGGAGFPTHAKLSAQHIHTLVVNAVECEPFLAADYRRMGESPEEVAAGIRIAAKTLGATTAVIAFKPVSRAYVGHVGRCVKDVPFKLKELHGGYPAGEGKLIIKALGGPAIRRPDIEQDYGYIVLNVHTLYRLARAVELGEPVTRRALTLAGDRMPVPCTCDVPIGMSFEEVFRQTGNDGLPRSQPLRLGGPMMSPETTDRHLPVTPRTLGILAFDPHHAPTLVSHCVGCRNCQLACPLHLQPYEIHHAVHGRSHAALAGLHLEQCIECGACEYYCSTNIPLMSAIREAKRMVNLPVLPFAAPALHRAQRYLPDCAYVAMALVPMILFSMWQFSAYALALWTACAAGAVGAEWLFNAVARGARTATHTVLDCTALVTGLLLAAALPAGFPPLIALSAAAIGIVCFKSIAGGVGRNFLNPALVIRALLLVIFPRAMTTWPPPSHAAVDALTTATPLNYIQHHGMDSLIGSTTILPLLRDLALGKHSGSMGEIPIVLCLACGMFLLVLRIINWRIPAFFLAGFIAAFVCTPAQSWSVETCQCLLVHLCSGGLVIGAFFYLTDSVGLPDFPLAGYAVAFIAGALVMVIRDNGYYPEGVTYGILGAQLLRPALDLAGRNILAFRRGTHSAWLRNWVRAHLPHGAVAAIVVAMAMLIPPHVIPPVVVGGVTLPPSILAAVSNHWGWHIEADVPGYAAPLRVAFDITFRGIVSNVVIVSHHETHGIGSQCADARGAAFRAMFNGLRFDTIALRDPEAEKDDRDTTIDAISGATVTCNNICHGVRNAADDLNTFFPFAGQGAQ